MYYKLRYNEDTEVFEVYDPHTNLPVAKGEELAYLKVNHNDLIEYHPLTEEDLITLIETNTIVYAEYYPKEKTHEFMSHKIAISWSGEDYLKSLIISRYR